MEEYRKKGYGKQALAYLAKLAVDKDCSRFEWSCLKWNKLAIEVYEKLLAKPLNEWVQFRLEGKDLGNLAKQFRNYTEK